VTEANGWPIRLIDTAGLRETTETIEMMGIEVSREYLERADLVLACGDSDEGLRLALDAVGPRTRAPILSVRTKCDLPSPVARREALKVSAETAAGLAELSAAIARALSENAGALQLDAPILTRERQRVAIECARDELRLFRDTFASKQAPAVVAAVHLRDATRELEELIGSVDVEDVLDRLFSRFCVGK